MKNSKVRNLKSQVKQSLASKTSDQKLKLTLLFREVSEEKIFVAECLEIPGCVSQGETLEKAEANIRDAVRLCLSVMFEDCLREAADHRSESISYVGIASQQVITVLANPDLELELV